MKWPVIGIVFCLSCAHAQGIAAAYATMATACDALEKQVIAREGSTEEADKAAIADIRQRCDTLFQAFDGVYELSKAQP